MILKTSLLYGIFAVIEARNGNFDKYCEIQSDDVGSQCFRKEIITSLPHSPNQLAVDRLTNHLYFSFDSGQGEYVPAKMQIGNDTIMVLKGVKDAFAIASDIDTGEIYFGGSHGIYRYTPKAKKLRRLAIDNLDIWWLVVNKNVIYFIKFPSLSAYKYENRTIKFMSQLQSHSVQQFVYDHDGNIFFINNTGLYGIKNGEDNAILIGDNPRFLGMATDNNGVVYLCSEDGIFKMTKVVQKLKRVINIQGILGITFDKDNNIIYSDSHDLVRLFPVTKENYFIGSHEY
ncbi:ommochrome-binding protein-like [Pectinophora gossypiella]|uniref:ommochrome-binding protein-like n=1 Tax=Pectinophora gossypiella TaxID=13191 RepID=UPI00214ECE70|nr:ommochrome-binding protein-like [Pectinophora gossypiella]